jgi:hypothetical protein
LLGTLDVFRASQVGSDGDLEINRALLAESIETLLNGIQNVTMIYDTIDVVVDQVYVQGLIDGSTDTNQIHFRQLVDGVPIEARVTLVLDRVGGVLALRGTLMRDNAVRRAAGPVLTEQQAIAAAIEAVLERNAVSWPLEARSAQLLHAFADDVSSTSPAWRVELGSQSQVMCMLSYRVDVDPTTGAPITGNERVDIVSFGIPGRDELFEQCRQAWAR